MTVYIRDLQAQADQKNAERADQQSKVLEGQAETLVPLEQRLRRLLQEIPAELQQKGLSLACLQARLRGRRRGHAHPGELGSALRRLGFKRERRWTGDAGFNAIWRRQ